MDDQTSIGSIQSVEDFVVIMPSFQEPRLTMEGDKQNLVQNLTDVLHNENTLDVLHNENTLDVLHNENMLEDISQTNDESTQESNCIDEQSNSTQANINSKNLLFKNIMYLGHLLTANPRRETEVNKIMSSLNQSESGKMVSLSVPSYSTNSVQLLGDDEEVVLATFPVSKMLFCMRGLPNSLVSNCFAFTFAHDMDAQHTNFQCHVFRCNSQDGSLVSQIVKSFVNSFQNTFDHIDNDEPLMSGSGFVCQDVKDGTLLLTWQQVIIKWKQILPERPPKAEDMVRAGIPDSLRNEVWQLLCGCQDDQSLTTLYQEYLTKDCPCDQVIMRDLHRTFPAHEFFKEMGGEGQRRLLSLVRAYAIHDPEINYCQGVSFLAAALLLHLPEEKSFCVLIHIMFACKLRELFRQGFQQLRLNFYQLYRLMQEQVPGLSQHFESVGVEVHMFASQWFLTLFTSKFPLSLVYRVIDYFLCDGFDTIFAVAIALLKMSEEDLKVLDFEGIFKYLRVQLPKKYRTDEMAKQLMRVAVQSKPTAKKLSTWAQDHCQEVKGEEEMKARLERELGQLLEMNICLERECDTLAHELINSKIDLRKQLDQYEDKCELLKKELLVSRSDLVSFQSLLVDAEDERNLLVNETNQLKELCRRELEKLEVDLTKQTDINVEYKQICSQMSHRLESQASNYKSELSSYKALVEECESCSNRMAANQSLSPLHDASTNQPSELDKATNQVRELELELARTKLALVECECRNQDLQHQLNQPKLNKWLPKTFTSFTARYKSSENKPECKSECKSESIYKNKPDCANEFKAGFRNINKCESANENRYESRCLNQSTLKGKAYNSMFNSSSVDWPNSKDNDVTRSFSEERLN